MLSAYKSATLQCHLSLAGCIPRMIPAFSKRVTRLFPHRGSIMWKGISWYSIGMALLSISTVWCQPLMPWSLRGVGSLHYSAAMILLDAHTAYAMWYQKTNICLYYIYNHIPYQYRLWSEWVIKFNGLFRNRIWRRKGKANQIISNISNQWLCLTQFCITTHTDQDFGNHIALLGHKFTQ